MSYRQADEMLMTHPAYESVDRLGNRWFQGRYRAGIREFGYPIRLPSEQWGQMAKMRRGFDERPEREPSRYDSGLQTQGYGR